MPDYVAILRRSIASLPEDGPDMRQAVYERARSALARQLTSVEPPLPAEEIEGHHQALEEAIDTVETELAETESAETELPETGSAEEADRRLREEPRREREPMPGAADAPMPASVRPGDAKPAEARPRELQPSRFGSSAPKPYETGPQAQKSPDQKSPEQRVPEQKPADRSAGEPKPAALAGSGAGSGAGPGAGSGAGERKADGGKKDAGAPARPAVGEPSKADKAPAPAGKDGKRPADDAPPPYPSERIETSRAPAIVAIVLIVLILGGVGALAYTQWETIVTAYNDIVSQSNGTDSDENVVGENVAGENVTGENVTGENAAGNDAASRMAGSSEPAAGGTSSPSPLTGIVEADRVEGKDEDRLLSGPALSPPPSPPAEEPPMEPETGETAPEAETGPGTGLAGPGILPGEQQAPPLVGQRAIFYEQGADGAAGQAVNGAVSWTSIEKDDGSPAIQATIDIPDRNATVTITMSKNSDVALPASHLIEIAFSGGPVEGTTVQRVPALVLKPNEQARGQPLAGAAVDVTGDLFWIALSDTADQVDRNLELLRSGSWFDLPILFNSGQRALITFEKGIPGDKVFENVMQQWAS